MCPDLVDKYLEETSIRYVTPRALSDPEPRPPQPSKTGEKMLLVIFVREYRSHHMPGWANINERMQSLFIYPMKTVRGWGGGSVCNMLIA